MSDLDSVAAGVLARALAGHPTLGAGRFVCVDGPAGSGKTTLATVIERSAGPAVTVVHMDDLLGGWAGLAAAPARVRTQIVSPLAAGRPGSYRRYDWAADAWAEEHTVEPGGLLVLEGCGAGSAAYAEHVGVLVWVEASPGVRLARGLGRDGEALRDRWLGWQADEDALFAAEHTRDRADVVVRT